jgi:hypothetical protein
MANERYEKLSVTLGSLGWREIIYPRIVEESATSITKLVAAKRDASESDDFLRGRISAFNWLLRSFISELNTLAKEAETPAAVVAPMAPTSPYETQPDDELLLGLTSPEPQTKEQ